MRGVRAHKVPGVASLTGAMLASLRSTSSTNKLMKPVSRIRCESRRDSRLAASQTVHSIDALGPLTRSTVFFTLSGLAEFKPPFAIVIRPGRAISLAGCAAHAR